MAELDYRTACVFDIICYKIKDFITNYNKNHVPNIPQFIIKIDNLASLLQMCNYYCKYTLSRNLQRFIDEMLNENCKSCDTTNLNKILLMI